MKCIPINQDTSITEDYSCNLKLLLLLAKLLEANCLPSEDTCLTCDVSTNQIHTVALPVLAVLTHCHCTFLSFPPPSSKQQHKNVPTDQMSV